MHRYVGVLFALLAAIHNLQVLAAGNIGCLFSDTLCEQEREWCFDDHAFGHCLPHYGHYREDDLHRYDLGSDELRLLEQEMQRLFLLGYRWSHIYTQCVLQELLHAIRHKADFDLSSCNGDVDQDLEGALRAIEGEELVDPRDLAIVRFTPSATDPHSDFADEVYFPPIKDHESEDHQDDDDQTEAGDHQESPTSEPGESSSGGTGGGGNSAGDSNGSSSSSSSPNFHPLGGIDTFPANPPGPPMSDAAVGAPSSFRDHPPPPRPPYDPRQQNYIRVYDPSDMDEYDDHYDDDDDSSSYRSPYHYQTPLNPVYRKRSRPVEEAPVFSGDKVTMSQLRRIANMLDNFRLQKNDLEEREDLEEGVFGESPARPMYSEAGLQFIPEVGDDDDPMETAAREAILSNMPQDLHVVQDGFRSMPDEFRNVPGVLDTFSSGNGRRYLNSLRNLPDAIRNIPEGLDVIPGAYNSIPAAPQDYRGPEPVAMENSIPRSFYMPDAGPLEVSKDDLPWNRLMLEEEEEEDEDDLQNSLPRSNNKNTALQEAFGPQLNAIRDFEDGDDFNDYQDYREGLLDEYGDYGQYDVLDQAFPFLQKFDKKDEERAGDDDDMAQDREWSFKRPERLDVKKPGPGFGVNNFAFRDAYSQDDDSGQLDEGAAEIPSLLGEGALLPSRLMSKNSVDLSRDGVGDPRGEVAEMLGDFALRENQEIPDVLLADEGVVEEATDEVVSAPKAEKLQEKKEQVDGASPATPTETPAKELEKPNSYVHISTAETLKTEKEGADLARYIVRLSGLTAAHLQNLKVGEDRIMFRIGENAKGITASDVAKKAEELRDQVKAKTGQTISQAGIGDETTMLALVYSSNKKHIVAAAAIVCGVMAALLVVASVLFFLRRNAKSKAKLLGLTAHDTEASKDYQDLCRARMAGKAGEGGKVEPPTTHVPTQRIASLSKDSDNGNNSPSSRSSTSSWSEEPVASNMDISTGHMVLNYMEDHLKNKDRLEQEWIALCAYEAEPCATTIAMKPENSKKNRYPDSVPYDHNRVILNSHANVNGSDYINASSITDHDPRNPAYIATQGPLNTTAADFWQLVWEQGSVVIVMLTRLTENGLAFCHRYWPEEGSDLYHIYEVHLVSEHIWCDDYLVRSFYLKNVKTGETRTVTQFHFLSWPDSGTPASTKALLEFRRKVNKSYRGRSCPIIVHCSDGIGRTGTYCLIDMVLNRMAKGAKEIDIAATLEHIRDQRPHMVKSKAQFEFVLMAVAEEVHAILKALPQ